MVGCCLWIDLAAKVCVCLKSTTSTRIKKRATEPSQGRGYRSRLDVEQRQSAVNEARLKQIEIDVLRQFTKAEEVVRLKGNWESAKASANGHEEELTVPLTPLSKLPKDRGCGSALRRTLSAGRFSRIPPAESLWPCSKVSPKAIRSSAICALDQKSLLQSRRNENRVRLSHSRISA